MANNRGKQRRAQKHQKKRTKRHQKRFQPAQSKASAQSDVALGDPGLVPAGPSGVKKGGMPVEKKLPAAVRTQIGYDAAVAPEASAWLAIEENQRLARVSAYHEAIGEAPPSLKAHAGVHVIVENQLAADIPSGARDALKRLKGHGLTRHEAVHCMGWLATEHMRKAFKKQQPVDDAVYERELRSLTPARWLELAGGG